jgi:hypothetical protein
VSQIGHFMTGGLGDSIVTLGSEIEIRPYTATGA